MDLLQAIKARRSIRKFKNIPVPENIIYEMLESARLAPSGGNAQAHVFGVIRDENLRKQLAEAAGNQMWIATAPLIFDCCGDISWDIAACSENDFGLHVNQLRFGADFIKYLQDYPDRKACNKLFHNSNPLIPAEHIFLTAVSYGLSACFVGYLDVEKASEILGLPEHIACLFLLPVGYADDIDISENKKAISEISFFDRYPCN